MIVNLENTTNTSRLESYPFYKLWGKIKSIFFIDPSFSWNTENDFDTESTWLSGIGNDYIRPVHEIKEHVYTGENGEYYLSIHDIERLTKDGKIRLNIKHNCSIDYHRELMKLHNHDFDIVFALENRTLIGRNTGTSYYGLETDNISVERIRFGEQPAWTMIRVELSDINDIYDKQVSFNPYRLRNVDVDIQNITSSTQNDMTFQVVDSVCGLNILGLESSDFTVVDNVSGAISFSTFTEVGNGYYSFTTASDIYAGSVSVSASNYNGTDNYALYTVPKFSSNFSSNFQK